MILTLPLGRPRVPQGRILARPECLRLLSQQRRVILPCRLFALALALALVFSCHAPLESPHVGGAVQVNVGRNFDHFRAVNGANIRNCHCLAPVCSFQISLLVKQHCGKKMSRVFDFASRLFKKTTRQDAVLSEQLRKI